MSEQVTAPMAGHIWKILVKVGDQVQFEDELMVLEALKMENPIYAPANAWMYCRRSVKETISSTKPFMAQ